MVLSFPACLKRYACKNFSVIYIYNIYWGGPAEGGRSVREGGQSHRYRKTKGLKGKNGILKRKRLQILFRHVGRDMLWEDIRNGTERHKQQEGPESRGRKVRERSISTTLFASLFWEGMCCCGLYSDWLKVAAAPPISTRVVYLIQGVWWLVRTFLPSFFLTIDWITYIIALLVNLVLAGQRNSKLWWDPPSFYLDPNLNFWFTSSISLLIINAHTFE